MIRLLPAITAVILLSAIGPARGQAPAGTWKMSIPNTNLTFLFTLEEKAGKWSGQFLGTNVPEFPKVNITDITVTPTALRMTFKLPREELNFDGRLPTDAQGRVGGSLQLGRMILVHMEPTKLKVFDRYEFHREKIEQATDAATIAEAAFELLRQAGDRKPKPEELKAWSDKAMKSAEAHGTRWQRWVATRLAQALAPQKDYADTAVAFANQAAKLLEDTEDATTQMEALEAIAQVMVQAGKADQAAPLQARLTQLEEKDLAEHAKKMPFKPDVFEGRKPGNDRAVLVELFTGAECPPCVAVDVGFDALAKTYKNTDVVLLQYHVHIPGPDPLTNTDTLARLQYYGKKVEGTPTIFFNGKPGAPGGGAMAAARKKYVEFRSIIDPLLEKPAEAKLQLSATRKGDEINIKCNVADVARTGEAMKLRLVLVEENVRYQGSNGLKYHHFVVRDFPGGVKGMSLTKKPTEQTVTVKLDEIRAKLTKHLDDFAARLEEGFPKPDRPMALKKLRVVALVQDDDTNEVLQATQVDVKE